MIDPDLERRLADCTELMETWRAFMDIINKAVKPPRTVTPQLEQTFLNAKARIAMLHDSFMESLKHDKSVGSNMLELVNRSITLRLLQKLSEPETKKMEFEWHEVFLLLNETISGLHEEKAKLATVNEFTHNLKKLQGKMLMQVKWFLTSIYLKIAVVLFTIIFVIWGIPALGIYDYNNLRNYPQVKGIVAGYLNFTRNYIGFDSAYYDLPAFLKALPQEKIVGVGQVKEHTGSDAARSATALLATARVSGDNARRLQEQLAKADGFSLLEFPKDNSTGTSFVYIFYYRLKADAKTAMSQYDQVKTQIQQSGAQGVYSGTRKANVFVLTLATNEELNGILQREVLGKTKPN